ncbi:T9SS C-terminal target domain-containing protein [candidate division KSB1 bacterium]|nr:MAG: T9SS C-terminal target domain-containing protein [candidate division KSB1 bacterium]
MILRTIFVCLALLVLTTLCLGEQHCVNLLCAFEGERPCDMGQYYTVSMWTNEAACHSAGTIYYSSDPPGALYDFPAESFFDIFFEVQTFRSHVLPGEFMPGDCFFLVANVLFENPDLPDLTCRDNVCVGADGRLYLAGACPPADIRLPSIMNIGDVFCFKVCHDVYWIPLGCTLPGPPVFRILEGCLMQHPNCYDPECLVPDPNCYVWDKIFCNGIWYLRFEYSCGYRQPVCYCVIFEDQLPVELLSFTATPGHRIVTLYWSTATENNNSKFEIERRISGDATFAYVGETPGAGASAVRHDYSHIDRNLLNGVTYEYRLVAVDANGNRDVQEPVITATPLAPTTVVTEYALLQNYPNPFNSGTVIQFKLPETSNTRLTVFDVTGREIAVLAAGLIPQGEHAVFFNGNDLPSGLYIYKLEAGSYSTVMKMMLLK